MNNMPQNDPSFLAFQRKLRANHRKKSLQRFVWVLGTVVLILALLAVGVFAIYRAGDKKESEKPSIPDLPDMQDSDDPGDTENPGDKEDPDKEDPDKEDPDKEDPDKEDPDKEDPDKEDPDAEKTVVYIDAGHGFTNSYGVPDLGTGDGTPYFELTGKYESDMNLEVALKLKQVMLARGYEVIMSRESQVDEHVTINERIRRANAAGADIFISVHANSSDNESAKGARVYYSTANAAQVKCKKYAELMAAALNAAEGVSLNRVNVYTDRPDVGVIKAVNVPTILVETCFVTSPEDAALAATEEWVAAMADAMANGIENYLKQAQSAA